MSIWAIQIGLGGLGFFFPFGGGLCSKSGKIALVEIGNECDQGALYEIPKELI